MRTDGARVVVGDRLRCGRPTKCRLRQRCLLPRALECRDLLLEIRGERRLLLFDAVLPAPDAGGVKDERGWAGAVLRWRGTHSEYCCAVILNGGISTRTAGSAPVTVERTAPSSWARAETLTYAPRTYKYLYVH